MVYNQPFPGETGLVYEYFCLYRDMGSKRSLRQLETIEVQGRHRKLRQIGQWSTDYSWKLRVDAYDADIAEETTAAAVDKRITEIEKFIADDITLASNVQSAFVAWCSSDCDKSPEVYEQWVTVYERVREWVLMDHRALPKTFENTLSTALRHLLRENDSSAITQLTGKNIVTSLSNEEEVSDEKKT